MASALTGGSTEARPGLCTNNPGELGCPAFEEFFKRGFADELTAVIEDRINGTAVPEHMRSVMDVHNGVMLAATDYGSESPEYVQAMHALRLKAAEQFIGMGLCPIVKIASGKSPAEVAALYSASCTPVSLGVVEVTDTARDH